MKKINFLLLGFAVLVTVGLKAQTADEIISKYIDAIGGKEKLGQVKSLTMESSVDIMGNASPAIEYLLDGKGFKSETDFNGSKIVTAFNEKAGWSINPMAGGAGAEAMPDEVYKVGKSQIYIGGALVNYAANGYTVQLLGKEADGYNLKLTNGGTESNFYIDPTTYYLTKVVNKGLMMGQPVEVVTTYTDHKKTDFGIVLPFSRNIDLGGFALSVKVNKVEANKEIDAKIFEQPK